MSSYNILDSLRLNVSVVLSEESSNCLWETKFLLCEVHISTVAKQAVLQLEGSVLSPGSSVCTPTTEASK